MTMKARDSTLNTSHLTSIGFSLKDSFQTTDSSFCSEQDLRKTVLSVRVLEKNKTTFYSLFC
ncbi:MAG: hypothetical protein ISS36_00630 [Candidatus Aenigmarchaeota archaeon]|nr:hypothetical protein [Candidatus Aenigmarchaeota archaeon]